MALIGQVVRHILANDAGVTALVGQRIYRTRLLQTTQYPAIAFRKADEDAEATLDSPATATPDFEIVCFAAAKGIVGGLSPEEQSERIDRAIYAALTGFSGNVVLSELSPPETVAVQGIFFVRSADFYDDRTETHQHGSVFSFRLYLD